MPPEGVPPKPHDAILRFEEIVRVVRQATRIGVRKVRLTGGEPLVRRGLTGLVSELRSLPGVQDLPLTTNGVRLAECAGPLADAGLTRVTISLDSLDRGRYARITRSDELDAVLRGLDAAIAADLSPVKINVVVLRGVNEDEPPAFARLAAERDLEVRFIEQMAFIGTPTGCGEGTRPLVTSAEVRARIEAEHGPLAAVDTGPGGTARVFDLPGGRGRIGLISPITKPFCAWCTRLRLTPDGKLRPCLASDHEIDVHGPLRSGASDDELLALLERAVAEKPVRNAACFDHGHGRGMSQIGG